MSTSTDGYPTEILLQIFPFAVLQLGGTAVGLDGLSTHNSWSHANGLLWFLMSFRMPLVPSPAFLALRSTKFTARPFDDITPEFYQAFPAFEAFDLIAVDPETLLRVLRADASLCPALCEFSMDGHLRLR
ncbi:hypothetical protein B0H19DRAFT_1250410 [Mycena capillaripes]|nr:hypothetical protein B0H19DRAFT_1250410 [Mycena capillaripes]